MHVQLLVVPYDTGLRGERMGRGPAAILDAGLIPRLTAAGHTVHYNELETRCPFRIEASVALDLQQQLAEAVGAARRAGRFPLVLAGNCNTSLGVMAALGSEEAGLVWFDAHGDFNTPDTSPSGFFDGMALAVATGRCWRTLLARLPGFAAVPDQQVILVGARDLDPGEATLLEESQVVRVALEDGGGLSALEAAVEALAARVPRVHLHLDLDVHDPEDAPANGYRAAGGPSRPLLRAAVERIAARTTVAAATLAAYDPAVDPDGRTAVAAVDLAAALVARLSAAGPPAGR